MVKSIKYLLLLICSPVWISAQGIEQLDLQQAYDLAQKNYPMIRQKDLVKKTAELNIENLQKGYLPQINISGQASYQSDVTKIDVPIPGINIETPSKDQYKVLADVSQLIYDGGVIKQQKVLQQLNASVEDQKVEVELYKVKERINQLYLGVLYLDAQLKQVDLIKSDLESGIKRVDAQVRNGVSFKSNLNTLKAELLKTDQRALETKSSRKGLMEALALFLGQPLDENVQLVTPAVSFDLAADITRPEMKLFGEQSKLIAQQNKSIDAKNLPKASLFVQGGYGRPGLDMLKNDFDFYYITGVRLNWSLSGFYTKKREKQLVEVNRQIVDIQKETFVLNTNTQLRQQQSDIDKLKQLVISDNEIIALRVSVKDAAKAQLDNGVITANDYLREVNAEDQARQTLIMHQVQLLQAQINYQTTSGKQ